MGSIVSRLIAGGVILCFFLACVVVVKFIGKCVAKKLEDHKKQIVHLIVTILNVVLILIGLTSCLGTIGVDVSAIIAGLGLTGFAVGFAVKDAISNVLSGVLIVLYEPFKLGDKIQVVGCEGLVVELNLRYTKLKAEGNEFIIPNSAVFGNWVKRYGATE